MNQPLWGIAYLLTSGFFGLGLIYDLVTIPRQVEDCNRMLEWKGESSIQIEINSGFPVRNDDYDDVIEADYEYIKSEEAARKRASGRYEKGPDTKTLEARVLEIADRADMHQISLKDLIREGIPMAEAKTILECMAHEGVCEEVVMDGTKIYCFS